jgi:hypothetical protein
MGTWRGTPKQIPLFEQTSGFVSESTIRYTSAVSSSLALRLLAAPRGRGASKHTVRCGPPAGRFLQTFRRCRNSLSTTAPVSGAKLMIDFALIPDQSSRRSAEVACGSWLPRLTERGLLTDEPA